MRLLATAALLMTMSVSAFAQADPTLPFNNLAHEYAECAAYFGIVSMALQNTNAPEPAAQYDTLMTQALQYANTTGKAIGLLQATTDSRVSIAIDEMRAKINDNTSNISILFSEYMEPCTSAMEDPEGRIAYWMSK